ncbi:hypothetical protein AX17_002037 [Amanita inopinata Kibby_2008]|nr:hypothetical protein AX17_002037 [Amanita inopinata Kibby_2008]
MDHLPNPDPDVWAPTPVNCDSHLQELLFPVGTGTKTIKFGQNLSQEFTVHVARVKAHLAENGRLLDVQVQEIGFILKRIEEQGKDIESLPYSAAARLVQKASYLSTKLIDRLNDIHLRELENHLED